MENTQVPQVGQEYDPRRYWCGVPRWLLRWKGLSPGAKLCFDLLSHYVGQAAPSQAELAEMLDVTPRQVSTYLKELRIALLLDSRKHGEGLEYFFLWVAPANGEEATDRSLLLTKDASRKETSYEGCFQTSASNGVLQASGPSPFFPPDTPPIIPTPGLNPSDDGGVPVALETENPPAAPVFTVPELCGAVVDFWPLGITGTVLKELQRVTTGSTPLDLADLTQAARQGVAFIEGKRSERDYQPSWEIFNRELVKVAQQKRARLAAEAERAAEQARRDAQRPPDAELPAWQRSGPIFEVLTPAEREARKAESLRGLEAYRAERRAANAAAAAATTH